VIVPIRIAAHFYLFDWARRLLGLIQGQKAFSESSTRWMQGNLGQIDDVVEMELM